MTLWAMANHAYIRGRLLLAGAPTCGYSMRDLLDIAYAAWADDVAGLEDGWGRRAKIDDEALPNITPDRVAWGTDVSAEPPAAGSSVTT